MKWLTLLLLVGCAPTALVKPDPGHADSLRAQVGEITEAASFVRSVSEAYCPQAGPLVPAIDTLCKGLEFAWGPYVDVMQLAPSALNAYEQGLLALDDAVRVVAVAQRAVDEAKAAALAVRDMARQL